MAVQASNKNIFDIGVSNIMNTIKQFFNACNCRVNSLNLQASANSLPILIADIRADNFDDLELPDFITTYTQDVEFTCNTGSCKAVYKVVLTNDIYHKIEQFLLKQAVEDMLTDEV